MGSDFLPFLPVVMHQLLAAAGQDVTAPDVDMDDVEDRSDIDLVEDAGGFWTAVRTAAVEEQASACQSIMLLVERLQEHFAPYVEQTVAVVTPLISSPHEDVRSFAMVCLPELVRAAAKASVPVRGPMEALASHSINCLVSALEKEGTMVLIMTALQSLKLVLSYSCSDWSAISTWSTAEPPPSTPGNSIVWLARDQMEQISDCAQILLRESLQRRAVLRAEAQVGPRRVFKYHQQDITCLYVI